MIDYIRSLLGTRPSRRSSHRRNRRNRRRRLERLEDRRVLATIVWDGGGGGSAWSDGANWFDQTNSVNDVAPATGDDVVIAVSGPAYNVNLDINIATGQTVESLNSFTLNSADATFVDSGRTLTVDGASSILDGTVNLTNATVEGTGVFTNQSTVNAGTGSSFGANVSLVNEGDFTLKSPATQSAVVTINGSFTNSVGGDVLIQAIGGNQSSTARLVANAGLTNDGTITLDSVGQFQLTYISRLDVNGGSLINNGFIETLTMEESGAAGRQLNAEIDNRATGVIDVNSVVTLTNLKNGADHKNAGQINLNNGSMSISGIGSFENQGTGAISGRNLTLTGQGAGSGATLTNDGSIALAAGGLGVTGYAAIVNNGAINITGGNAAFGSYTSLTNTGDIDAGAGRTITFTGGSIVNQPGGTLDGLGVITLNSTTFDITTSSYGTGSSLAELNLNSSAVAGSGTFTNQSVLNMGNGSSFGAAVSLVNEGDFILRSPATQSSTGTVNGSFTNAVGGDVLIQAIGGNQSSTARLVANAGLTNDGTITLDSVGQFQLTYISRLDVNGGSLINNGVIETLIMEETGAPGRQLNAEIDNRATGVIDVNAAATNLKNGADHKNAGQINLNSGSMSITGISSFDNTGTVSGPFSLSAAGGVGSDSFVNTGTIDVGGVLSLSSFSDVTGTGTAGGDVTVVSSHVKPGLSPGIFNVSGSYTQTIGGGSLTIEIGGDSPGNGSGFHDQLNVVGAVTIASNMALNTSLFGGYTPVGGDSYVVINNAGTDPVVGTFNGLVEGAVISTNFHGSGETATITYQGGSDNNDVVINIVDNTPPAPPSDPDLDGGSDSGSSDTDAYTNVTLPSFSGTAEAGSTVDLFSNLAGALGTATAHAITGAWSIVSSVNLADSVHQITATATDAAGNTSASSNATSVTIDTIAPPVPGTPDLAAASDTGPSSIDDNTSDNTPTLSGGAEANAIVELFAGAASVGQTVSNGAWVLTTGSINDGNHLFTAVATDVAGNLSGSSTALAVVIDTVSPDVTVDLAVGQLDPASSSPINFAVAFTEPILGFDSADVTIGGSAGATTAAVTGAGSTYNVAVSGMTQGGSVTLDIGAGVANDLAGNLNAAASAIDNSVDYWDAVYDFSAATFAAAESDATFVSNVVEITRSGNTLIATNVDVALAGTTATPGIDFNSNPVTVAFALGETTKTVPIQIFGDDTVELDETVGLSFFNFSGTGQAGTSNASASMTITNDDTAEATIVANDPTAGEGGGDGQFTVSLSAVSDSDTVITYSIAGSADNSEDYSTLSGDITVPANQLSATVDVVALQDLLLENTETVDLTLSSAVGNPGISIGAANGALVNISDDESVSVEFLSTTSNLTESTISQLIQLRLTGAAGVALAPGVTVSADVIDSGAGSGISGVDYTAFGIRTANFGPGAAVGDIQTVALDVLDDAIVEPDEDVHLAIATVAGPGASVGTQIDHVVTIFDDDTITVEFSEASGGDAEADGANLPEISVTGEIQSGFSVQLDVAVTGGTATATDFAAPAMLNIPSGAYVATSFAIPQFTIADDSVVEPDESIVLGGIAGADTTVGQQDSFIYTILNDDALTVEFDQPAGSDLEAVGGNLPKLLVTGEVQTGYSVSIQVTASAGSATGGGLDYDDPTALAVSGSLSADAFSIPGFAIIDDPAAESDETIDLALAAGNTVIVGDANGDSTTEATTSYLIVDDDNQVNAPPQITSLSTDATFEDKGQIGEDVELLALFTDPDTGDTHTAVVNWGDQTTSLASVNSLTGIITATHQYQTGGIFDVSVTIEDGSGASDDDATLAVVQGVRLAQNGELQVVGTSRSDNIHIHKHHHHVKVKVRSGWSRPVWYSFAASEVSSLMVIGCDGNDRIHIAHGLNHPATVIAGAGHDLVISSGGDDSIDGGSGNDDIYTHGGRDTIVDASGRNRIWSGAGDDQVTTGSGNDWIWTAGGDDQINAGAGDNCVHGGRGSDDIITGAGDDFVHGGDGDDVVRTGDGRDWIDGGAGNDSLFGASGNDHIFAGRGNDIVFGGAGCDYIDGGGGHDLLFGGAGNDYLNGGRGHDILIGGRGRDTLCGGRGNDLLIGGQTAINWETASNHSALDAALSEWAAGNLANTLDLLGPILDDNERDLLYGQQGCDSFLAGLGDQVWQ
ncbi:MAG: Ig-like domain-containing protein [Pirellulaceae bacterium]|jgi:hypothetical protein|nr:Ig-like domain-containing protein [Pirellulaceae bacterium]